VRGESKGEKLRGQIWPKNDMCMSGNFTVKPINYNNKKFKVNFKYEYE
jgi:hypothetical protein